MIANAKACKYVALIIPAFLIAMAFSFLAACDSSSSATYDDQFEDIEGLAEQCNSYYTKYSLCVNRCDWGGFCLEKCVDVWYGTFLECCDEFEAETGCHSECLDTAVSCFDGTDLLDHQAKTDCFLDFADCYDLCSPPIATADNAD